jgi:BirA family biotin operon repressor/biotin-[acetyl-CoA-carboxylase] ligase
MIIGSKLIFLENLPSTNDYGSELLRREDPPEGTIIRTNYQSKGRGQAENRWESEDGKNLLISILLYPDKIDPSDQFLISITISLGICDFLMQYIPSCTIKWPNDIYVNNDKIAGILIENTIMGDQIEKTIAGIGININQQKFISDAPNPVSLSQLTGEKYDLNNCLRELCSALDTRYKQLISEDYKLLRNDYNSRLYRLNNWHNFRDQKEIYCGRILAVKNNGRLLVEKKNGTISEYEFKEVDFII